MLVAASDPADVLRWAIDHGQSLVWVLLVALAFFGNIVKKVAGAARRAGDTTGRSAPDPRAPGVRSPIVKLIQSARDAARAPAPVPAHAQRSRGHGAHAQQQQSQQPPRAPSPAPSERILSFVEADARPLPALLESFGDPAGARRAVVLAEILGPPIALRPPAPSRW